MKLSIIAPIVSVIVVVAAVSTYYATRISPSSTPSTTPVVGDHIKVDDTPLDTRITLKSLITAGKDQQCTFSDSETGSVGTVHVSSGRVRGDFTSKSADGVLTTHMISDSKVVYIWMDELQSAMKMSFDSLENLNDRALTNAPKTIDINKKVEYECRPWTADEAMFAVPTDRTFTDMSAVMDEMRGVLKEAGASGVPSNENACLGCSYAPEESRAECLRVLNCE